MGVKAMVGYHPIFKFHKFKNKKQCFIAPPEKGFNSMFDTPLEVPYANFLITTSLYITNLPSFMYRFEQILCEI